MKLPNERYGLSFESQGNENAIWQCPEVLTVQAECVIEDNRNGKREPFTVFYTVEDEDDWRRDLSRILRGLGYELCMVTNHFVRKSTLDAYEMHLKGKSLED